VDEIRYDDESDAVLVALATEYAPLVEAMAETVVAEIQRELDSAAPSGETYYIRRAAHDFRAEWRRNRREFLMASYRAAQEGTVAPQGPARTRATRTYIASAPGQPPASPTQRYRNSWHVSKVVRRDDVLIASAFSKAKASDGQPLGVYLEYGTTKMRPRPHIRPALERARERVRQMIGDVGDL
jgi:hypothetical protein